MNIKNFRICENLKKKISKCKLTSRGFIGAIGDDLPSIIPIVTALLIFFSIFTLTLNTYNEKNAEIQKMTNLMSISRTIKGDSIVEDYNSFEKRCSETKMKNYPYNFMVGIFPIDADTNKITNDFGKSSFSAPQGNFLEMGKPPKKLFCGYERLGGTEFNLSQQEYMLRFYPVAVQQKKGDLYFISPALMAMIIWD